MKKLLSALLSLALLITLVRVDVYASTAKMYNSVCDGMIAIDKTSPTSTQINISEVYYKALNKYGDTGSCQAHIEFWTQPDPKPEQMSAKHYAIDQHYLLTVNHKCSGFYRVTIASHINDSESAVDIYKWEFEIRNGETFSGNNIPTMYLTSEASYTKAMDNKEAEEKTAEKLIAAPVLKNVVNKQHSLFYFSLKKPGKINKSIKNVYIQYSVLDTNKNRIVHSGKLKQHTGIGLYQLSLDYLERGIYYIQARFFDKKNNKAVSKWSKKYVFPGSIAYKYDATRKTVKSHSVKLKWYGNRGVKKYTVYAGYSMNKLKKVGTTKTNSFKVTKIGKSKINLTKGMYFSVVAKVKYNKHTYYTDKTSRIYCAL